jgi:hypothetical protein
MKPRTELSEELELVTCRELMTEWAYFNRSIFGNSLKKVSFQLHHGKTRLGYWDRGFRVISLSQELVFEEPWLRVLAVLKHEMLHQFCDETMGLQDLPPHGEVFEGMRKKFKIENYEEVGLAPKTTGSEEDRSAILQKVQKLLSLAQSDQLHEAEAAMSKANALMLKWNLQQRDLHVQRKAEVRHIGKPSKVFLHLKMISCLLRDYFFVDVIWVQSYDVHTIKRARILEIIGRPENVALAEYVYHYLLNIGEQHWRIHRKKTGGGNRMNFLYGMVVGFYDKCKKDRSQQESDSPGLVWRGETWLKELMQQRHPRIKTMAQSQSRMDQQSFKAGHSQGEKLVLKKGVQQGTPQKGLSSGLAGLIDS